MFSKSRFLKNIAKLDTTEEVIDYALKQLKKQFNIFNKKGILELMSFLNACLLKNKFTSNQLSRYDYFLFLKWAYENNVSFEN